MDNKQIIGLTKNKEGGYNVVYEQPEVTPVERLANDIHDYYERHTHTDHDPDLLDNTDAIRQQLESLNQRMSWGAGIDNINLRRSDVIENFEFTTSFVGLPCGGYILGDQFFKDFPVRKLVVGKIKTPEGVDNLHYSVTLQTRKKIDSVTLSDVLLLVFLMREIITDALHKKNA